MKKVEIGNAVLYNADCRDVIPTLAGIEGLAVVSDLPYGIEELVGGYGRGGATIMNDKNLDVAFDALYAVVDTFPNLRMLVFYSCRITDQFFVKAAGRLGRYVGELIWDKKAPGTGNPIRYQHENIAIFETGTPLYEMGCALSIIPDTAPMSGGMRHSRDSVDMFHPHKKPDILMQTCVNVAGGAVVLDMFMGSGSTGVAALKTGRKFIGIELDPKHFDTACKRITEADATPGIF